MQSLLLVIVAVSLAGTTPGGDACSSHPVYVGACCKTDGEMHPTSAAIAEKCTKKYFSKTPSTDEEMERAFSCVHECVFAEDGLLTAEGKLDKTAIFKLKQNVHSEVVGTLMEAVDRKCLESYEAAVDLSQECRSGAHEFFHCVTREIFLNCPASLWESTQECEELKADIASCPQAYVVLPWEKKQ